MLIDDDKQLGRHQKGLMLCVLPHGDIQKDTLGSCCQCIGVYWF